MRRFWHRTPRELLLALAIAVLLLANSGFAASRNDKSKIPLVRWDEQRPGCTFSRSDDGKYRYGLSHGDVRITVAAELQEFVGNNSLRFGRLGPGNPETSGWVMFSTQSKWISGWKKPEEFILRVPFDGKIFEFPFKLPPKPGEIILRRRE